MKGEKCVLCQWEETYPTGNWVDDIGKFLVCHSCIKLRLYPHLETVVDEMVNPRQISMLPEALFSLDIPAPRQVIKKPFCVNCYDGLCNTHKHS